MSEHKLPVLVRTWFGTPTLRVAEYRMEPGISGQEHFHSAVDELCVCLEGVLTVSRQGSSTQRLKPGERVLIPAGQIHRLYGAQECECRYLVIQGVGAYDFIAV
jgi:quercetin dioxygenase-like cupin family protein